jgi:hypothetical protein
MGAFVQLFKNIFNGECIWQKCDLNVTSRNVGETVKHHMPIYFMLVLL